MEQTQTMKVTVEDLGLYFCWPAAFFASPHHLSFARQFKPKAGRWQI
ncbi:MAG: hypothetical protein L7W39_00095 [Alphaproteobacteria bacterium]|nr:hypothetical protein [Alphaproteobacteria bacterium]